MDYFKEYKRTANLSFLENVLMDTENGYKKTKITRNFIIK
jgi:hypothetical protein